MCSQGKQLLAKGRLPAGSSPKDVSVLSPRPLSLLSCCPTVPHTHRHSQLRQPRPWDPPEELGKALPEFTPGPRTLCPRNVPGLPTLSILLHGNKDHQNSQWHHGSGRKTWGTTGLSARLEARFRDCQFLPSEPRGFQIWTINLLVLTFKMQFFVCLFVCLYRGGICGHSSCN